MKNKKQRMKTNFLLISLAFTSITYAQDLKTISGKVTENSLENTPLEYAVVSIENTEYAVETDANGYFMIEIPTGSHTLTATYAGYKTQNIICSEDIHEINFTLEQEEGDLDEIVISLSRSKTTETALLDDQRKSLEFKQEIGSQELSRKGVSDAAGAVTKTSGVSKQESTGGIFVRGLGDRYNSTFLNGLPLVSNDPEKKNIDLSIFSTDIVNKISIDKTFLTRYSGDFGGASVDISSKTLETKPYLSVEIGSSVNTNAISQSQFSLPQQRNQMGFGSNNQVPNNAPNQYFFSNPLNSKSVTPIGYSFNLNGGTSWNVGNEGKLSLFATLGFQNDYGYREGIDKQVNAQGVRLNDYFVKKSNYTTKTTGMATLDYEINTNNKLTYTFLAVNNSLLQYDHYEGYIRDKAETDNGGLVQRNTYVQNTLTAHQLLGKHTLTDQNTFYWGTSFNQVNSYMPDRTQTSLKYDDRLDGYRFITNSSSDNHRYFHGLTENEIAVNAAIDQKFGKISDSDQYKGKVIVGYNGRFKNRDFQANQYNFDIANNERETVLNPYNIDAFFNADNYQAGKFGISTFRGSGADAGAPQYYNGDMQIHAGFINIEYQLSEKLTGVLGARFEKINQNVEWKTQLDNTGNSSELTKNAFLPSLHLKYAVSPIQNLRFAASKTYTLPQFKERAPFIYEDVTEIKFGNKDLYASDNYNVDIKWEYFPTNDELLSATVFGKYIQNPINETNIASSTNDISYVNTGDYGYVAGIEIEARKNIVYINGNLDNKISLGVNAAYMHTEQELNSDKIEKETEFSGNFTYQSSGFSGAPEFLANVDLTYSKKFNENKNILATVAYNYGSDRIYALGIENKGNLVDKGFGMLDLIVKSQLNKSFSLGITAKNLLNPAIERTQQNLDREIVVRSFKLGTNVSVSLQYKF